MILGVERGWLCGPWALQAGGPAIPRSPATLGRAILSLPQVAVDIVHHKTMFDLHMKVSPSEVLVGWWVAKGSGARRRRAGGRGRMLMRPCTRCLLLATSTHICFKFKGIYTAASPPPALHTCSSGKVLQRAPWRASPRMQVHRARRTHMHAHTLSAPLTPSPLNDPPIGSPPAPKSAAAMP